MRLLLARRWALLVLGLPLAAAGAGCAPAVAPGPKSAVTPAGLPAHSSTLSTTAAPSPLRTGRAGRTQLTSSAPGVVRTPRTLTTSAGPAAATIHPLTDDQWARMGAAGVWRSDCPGGRSTLRRVDVRYVDFEGRPQAGALVVNADVAAATVRIFERLYADKFPIRRIEPIEFFGGDDNASMRADNTSAFNCRKAGQSNAPASVSPHANGRAIDINPYENPWVDPRCGCFSPSADFGRQRSGRGVVTAGGAVVRIFEAQGWIWRGSGQAPDFQHFDTGYPSRAWSR